MCEYACPWQNFLFLKLYTWQSEIMCLSSLLMAVVHNFNQLIRCPLDVPFCELLSFTSAANSTHSTLPPIYRGYKSDVHAVLGLTMEELELQSWLKLLEHIWAYL